VSAKWIRAGVYSLVAFAVAAFGAVGPRAEFVLQAGAAVLLLAWCLPAARHGTLGIRPNWLYLPFLGLCIIAASQYLFGLSVYPHATKVEVLRLGTYLFVGFLAGQTILSERDRNGFLRFLMILGFAVSLFAIVQFYTWNGKLYWTRAVENAGTPFGPFVDRDHFAGFVELIAPFSLASLVTGAVRRDAFPVVTLFGVLPLGAAVLCGSRGGIISLVIELAVLAALLSGRLAGRKVILSALLLLVLCAGWIGWLGVDRAAERFKNLRVSELSQDRRMSVYRDTWRIFLDHRAIGTGLGTLEFIFPRYESFYDGNVVDHAHNDYLELLAETGIAGGICGLGFIAILFWRGLANLQRAQTPTAVAFYCGALAACAGMVIHSFVDFNLHIPSNALLFFLLAFVACSPQWLSDGVGDEAKLSADAARV